MSAFLGIDGLSALIDLMNQRYHFVIDLMSLMGESNEEYIKFKKAITWLPASGEEFWGGWDSFDVESARQFENLLNLPAENPNPWRSYYLNIVLNNGNSYHSQCTYEVVMSGSEVHYYLFKAAIGDKHVEIMYAPKNSSRDEPTLQWMVEPLCITSEEVMDIFGR